MPIIRQEHHKAFANRRKPCNMTVVMNITIHPDATPWLLLIFSLPSKKGSERVGIWRKLQKYGTLSLRNSGYVLPTSPTNHERFEWLAASIRGSKGEASVLQVRSIDDLPNEVLKQRFREERKADYMALIREVQAFKRADPTSPAQLARLKRRLNEIIEIDFFESALRGKAQEALLQAERPVTPAPRPGKGRLARADYRNRLWLTRPRPGIDRIAAAWLIKSFIDPKAIFIFDTDADSHPDAVPFDMYQGRGFGHEGENCTFETIVHRFAIRDKKVGLIAKAIHDADVEDDKYGRNEGIVVNQILKGWANQGIADEELMRRGMEVIEGLYRSTSERS
jgi:hypothetical protein